MRSAQAQDINEFPDNAVFVVGAGHFGGRAARLITQTSDSTVFVLDIDEARLQALNGIPATLLPEDGIQFLVRHHHLLRPSHVIVPALPHHLAFEWLRYRLAGEYTVKRLAVPEAIRGGLPHTWPASEGSLLVSYADFVCPDDCPEPEHCTVTGEKRTPLHEVIAALVLPDFRVHVIRSHQLAPGLGGYRMADLTSMAQRLTHGTMTKWLLATSCRCHGVITALEVQTPNG